MHPALSQDSIYMIHWIEPDMRFYFEKNRFNAVSISESDKKLFYAVFTHTMEVPNDKKQTKGHNLTGSC